ncbi:MAG TPA: IS1595 family transposase [Steroidobacteraceae bacterium]|jgi:transposase-like protein
MSSYLSAPHFHDEASAFKFVEDRVWPTGPVCPHCASVERIGKLEGKSTRMGVYKCYNCRKPFTVRVGTIFEDSHIALHLWLQAIFLIASSKKGISSNQLHRVLGVTLKTAWFLSHRIRFAMDQSIGKLGEGGGIVEADETYFGRKPNAKKGRGGFRHKNAVLALVERDGNVKSVRVKNFNDIKKTIAKHIDPAARFMTDEHKKFRKIGKSFASHETVNHFEKEYARGDVTTNTVEGVFSIFKRGMEGIYQHCDASHLHRYLAEFDFRYNNRVALEVDDKQRADKILSGVTGKRLTYQTTTR